MNPAINTALPTPPLNSVPKCLICRSFKYLQGWWLILFSSPIKSPWMAFLSSLWRNLLKLILCCLNWSSLPSASLKRHRQYIVHLAMISPSCHPENCVFLLCLLPSALKGQPIVSFFVTPITWQLNSDCSNLEALVYVCPWCTAGVKRRSQRHFQKVKNCHVLINSSCPSVTFHSTLWPECEKQTQRTGEKRFCCAKTIFSVCTYAVWGGEVAPAYRRN